VWSKKKVLEGSKRFWRVLAGVGRSTAKEEKKKLQKEKMKKKNECGI